MVWSRLVNCSPRVAVLIQRLSWQIRVIDATGGEAARSPRLVSCIETLEPGVYGTRVLPGWYQSTFSEVPGEDRAGPLCPPFQMLMLPWWVLGTANVRVSPVSQRFPEMSGLARTPALPEECWAKPPQATSEPPPGHPRAKVECRMTATPRLLGRELERGESQQTRLLSPVFSITAADSRRFAPRHRCPGTKSPSQMAAPCDSHPSAARSSRTESGQSRTSPPPNPG